MLIAADLAPAMRSEMFSDDLRMAIPGHNWVDEVPVLLGDSLGEMYFYLSLADRVVVGGGFHPKGAHNIIEPLALENPFVEAEAAGVALSVPDGPALVAALSGDLWATPEQITAFVKENSGASGRTVAAIQSEIPNR